MMILKSVGVLSIVTFIVRYTSARRIYASPSICFRDFREEVEEEEEEEQEEQEEEEEEEGLTYENNFALKLYEIKGDNVFIIFKIIRIHIKTYWYQ